MSYTCDVCHKPIVDEDPHTAWNGEDVHEACCDVCYSRGNWPAPDPAKRYDRDGHPCEYLNCHDTLTHRFGYWGEWMALCYEHGELIGDDGSMDDTYDDDERPAAMKRAGL